jgi:G:T-mismatch repair DNA endonuclease (very short patch repair protein)
MPDVFNKAKRSQVMAAIHSTGNKDTELKLISIFRARGITGWRRSQRITGKPDFVFLKNDWQSLLMVAFGTGASGIAECRKATGGIGKTRFHET